MVLDKLREGAFGIATKENPYKGDLGTGISYDRDVEANFTSATKDGERQLLTGYRAGAAKLVKHLPVKTGQTVLDLGSGTGISALELLVQNPGRTVLGVEQSDGMLLVARYKFHKDEGKELLANVDDTKLIEYWNRFREESKSLSDRVDFVQGDMKELGGLEAERYDAVTGIQSIHWVKDHLPQLFNHVYRVLKPGGMFVWSSASHFHNDSKYPSATWGFRYNDLLRYIMEEVHSHDVEVGDLMQEAKPAHTSESLMTISNAAGFDTKHAETYLQQMDLQFFLRFHVPIFARQLIRSQIPDEKKNELIEKAIQKAITNPVAMNDTQHKFDIVPIFISKK